MVVYSIPELGMGYLQPTIEEWILVDASSMQSCEEETSVNMAILLSGEARATDLRSPQSDYRYAVVLISSY